MEKREYVALAHAIAKSTVDGSSVISNICANLKMNEGRFVDYVRRVAPEYSPPVTTEGAHV